MNSGPLSYGLDQIGMNSFDPRNNSTTVPNGPSMNGVVPSASMMGNIGAGIGSNLVPQTSPLSKVSPTSLSGEKEGGWMAGLGGMEGLKSIGSGIQAAGNIFMAFQNNKLAREQFSFQKDAYRTNLANESQAYNTNLAGSAKAAMGFEGRSQDEIDTYVANNRI